MEVIFGAIDDDCMASIVSSLEKKIVGIKEEQNWLPILIQNQNKNLKKAAL